MTIKNEAEEQEDGKRDEMDVEKNNKLETIYHCQTDHLARQSGRQAKNT